MKNVLITAASLLFLVSCNSPGSNKSGSDPGGTPEPVDQTGPSFSLKEVWRTDTIMRTCESVLFDRTRQVLFVSCINGAPDDKNGAGYIAMLDPDGNVKSAEWISGLDAPKGMGISGDLLYVTDIDQLVVIDIEKAEIKERIAVEGASFLNDIDINAEGEVYFSDSGTGLLWIYSKDGLRKWITVGSSRPNGLYIEENRVLLTCSESRELKIIDITTGEPETVTTEIGRGDGVEYTGREGYYLTSSWSGELFLILPDFSKISLLKTSDQGINSADIAFNIEKQVVYVPTFFDNRVVAYELISN